MRSAHHLAQTQCTNIMQKPYGSVDSITGEIKLTEKGLQKFWSKINKDGPVCIHPTLGDIGPCWLWTACKRSKESLYGIFTLNHKSVSSHRVSWVVANGQIPAGIKVLHHCDNPPCCNPNHLFAGTSADNMADRDAKGRQAKGERNGARLHPEAMKRGGDNSNSKLHESDIPEIRRRRLAGEFLTVIAKDYGVSLSTIHLIGKGMTWKHVVS